MRRLRAGGLATALASFPAAPIAAKASAVGLIAAVPCLVAHLLAASSVHTAAAPLSHAVATAVANQLRTARTSEMG